MRFDDLASVSGLTTNPCKNTKRIRSGLESGAKQRRAWERGEGADEDEAVVLHRGVGASQQEGKLRDEGAMNGLRGVE
jgi:hypothetical protein